MQQQCDPKTASRWTARVIPIVLAGVLGYGTYVVIRFLCVDYLLHDGSTRSQGAAIAILIIYFLLLLLVVASYIRILVTIAVDPGYIPLGPTAERRKSDEKKARNKARSHGKTEHSEEYQLEQDSRTSRTGEPDSNPDSPGLEEFYTKDIFVCEMDGRPKWCSECGNWKPDRTHHCSDVGRCIRKMDHFCPWVGGSVGEANFKFFIQFVTYASIYCLFVLIVMAYYIKKIGAVAPRVQPGVAIGLAGFFGLFTAGMAITSGRFAILNITTIENLNYKHKVWDFAVLIPPPEFLASIRPPGTRYPAPSYRTITYPLQQEATNVANGNVQPGVQEPTLDSQEPTSEKRRIEQMSERDRKATRTFAILSTESGENPFDLGSYLENWKTVMGDNVLDWILPIRRSPCCDHEEPRSQFQLGPAVDLLLAKHGFLHPSEVRSVVPHRPSSVIHDSTKRHMDEKTASNGMV